MTKPTEMETRLLDVAARIRELREIAGFTVDEMAEKTSTTAEEYASLEKGEQDFPFTFIHKCAHYLGVEITDILEGHSARLSAYTVTRHGGGQITGKEPGIEVRNIAPFFRNKIAEPYWVRYSYSEEQVNAPIHLTTHSGQEFDLILSGKLMVQVGNNTEILEEGDSIYYNSSMPHGMIAVGGEDCVFVAVVLPDEAAGPEPESPFSAYVSPTAKTESLVANSFIDTVEDEAGALQKISFKNEDKFNFSFDVLDVLAEKSPNKMAMLHVSSDLQERRFTFEDISRASSRAANYFKALGIKKGDRVMLVLKRHYQFWFSILGLHKLGAVAIPATHQLLEHDFEYRFNAAGVSAIVCTSDDGVAEEAQKAIDKCPQVKIKVIVGNKLDGWHDFNEEYMMYRSSFPRPTGEAEACGSDPSIMFFTSGTTGYPKIATHTFTYPLGHFITAKYWHCVDPDGIHFTISDTGWGKALWGKLYGQWLCEAAIFVYDFDRFDAHEILAMFKRYNITTFCAPPTMYRFIIKEDLSQYDLSTIKHATTAGEALNPEVYHQFYKATGLKIMEAFGQTETTVIIGNFVGTKPKIGSMGKPSPMYDVHLLATDGTESEEGDVGEICIRCERGESLCGLFLGYYMSEEKTNDSWHDGYYHTGDTAWRDEDGYLWYVGRVDDLIKSSGYRIGPFEIESVIMELPYILECGVSAAPDEVRGQIVKASIVLVSGTEGTDDLKKEIQTYVKERTAPYKYPRIVVFRDELPKTISGKIQRNKL